MKVGRVTIATVCVVMAILVPSGCGPGPSAPIRSAEVDRALPDQTLVDWVTFSDAAAVFSVVAQSKGEPLPDEKDAGEGYLSRTVMLDLSPSRWVRPSAPEGRDLPTEFQVSNGGWVFHGDEESPIGWGGQARLEVGKEYLGIFSWGNIDYLDPSATPTWILIDAMPIVDGVVQPAADPVIGLSPAEKAMAGQTVSACMDILRRQAPLSVAVPYLSVQDSVQRWGRVDSATSAPVTPDPIEKP